jgi:hypothetical protein
MGCAINQPFQPIRKELIFGGRDWFSASSIRKVNIADDYEHDKFPARIKLRKVNYSPIYLITIDSPRIPWSR